MAMWPQILPFLLFGAFLAWLWWRSRIRTRDIRALTASMNLHYLGDTLPRSFPLVGTPLNSVTSIWNVIDGEPHGTRIVAFDCKFGEGKGSWRRTIIAVKTEIGHVNVSAFEPSLRVEQIKDWVVIWRPKELSLIPAGLMPIAELRAYLEAL